MVAASSIQIQDKPLSRISIGERGVVMSFTDNVLGNKLMSMGLLPGSSVKLIRKTPLGSTFYVKVNDQFYLALRKQEAACIILK